jgi:hypothetical protein
MISQELKDSLVSGVKLAVESAQDTAVGAAVESAFSAGEQQTSPPSGPSPEEVALLVAAAVLQAKVDYRVAVEAVLPVVVQNHDSDTQVDSVLIESLIASLPVVE